MFENPLYYVIAIPQLIILGWYFYKLWQKKQLRQKQKEVINKEYPYEGLRNMALNSMPGAIIANVPHGEVFVYGVLMDWDMGDDMVTLAAQITGEANLYVKSGGGFIGAGRHIAVSEAAQAFVRSSHSFLQYAFPATATPLPGKNCIKFYFLTNNGKYAATDDVKNMDGRASQLLPLFEGARALIAEMSRQGS